MSFLFSLPQIPSKAEILARNKEERERKKHPGQLSFLRKEKDAWITPKETEDLKDANVATDLPFLINFNQPHAKDHNI